MSFAYFDQISKCLVYFVCIFYVMSQRKNLKNTKSNTHSLPRKLYVVNNKS